MSVPRDLVDELLHAKVKAKLFGGDHAPQLGRLRILDRLGAGAMGTVFSAYDPRLERKVAVKVLRTREGASRVLVEARALAKLAHPNVVTVHDADELDGLVFIVMELAPGVPLRAWAAGTRTNTSGNSRDWHDVVRVMREAGAGIAAAHDAGLVHRDIKPDNILVGEDRARVVDFGLANAVASDDGASAGTPFYMAPEVLAGGAATAHSDQFSFGVTLYEALYGRRPYDVGVASTADTVPASAFARAHDELVTELRTAALGAAQAPRPAGTRVPTWVHAIVTRALAADPVDRYGSMRELVDALGRDRRRRTKVIAIAVAALAAGGIAGALAFRSPAGNPCLGAASRTEATWNDDVRVRTRSALGTAPWTAQTIGALDGHVAAWQVSYRRVCEATRVRGDQSDSLLDLRMRCLDRSLARLGALTHAFTNLDANARAAAPSAVGELPPPGACEAMTSAADLAVPTDAAQRDKALAAERQLDAAWASFVLGRYKDARSAAEAAEAVLSGVTAPRIRAAVLALAASVEARTGDPQRARARLDEALLAAAEAGAPELEYDIWARRMRNELFGGDPAKVIEWATFARAAAKRTGRQGAELDGIVAEALRAAGKLDASRELLERALASSDTLRPEQRALLEMNLGSVQLAAGDSTAALETFTRARDRVLSALGDHHPDLALYADKIGAAKRARGRLRDARRWHDISLALRSAAFGDKDRAVGTSLLYRAQTLLEAGELRAARSDAETARKIREATFGGDSPRVGEVVAVLGDIDAAAGAREAAASLYARAKELDPRLDLVARRAAIAAAPVASGGGTSGGGTSGSGTSGGGTSGGGTSGGGTSGGGTSGGGTSGGGTDDEVSALGRDETPSVDRTLALAIRIARRANTEHAASATAEAAALRTRFKPQLDPLLGYAIGAAQLAAGDQAAAAQIWASLVPTLGNEPTRTALRIFVALARTSDTQAQAAARAAISLYQAMPELDRTDMDEMWAISRRP